jgi:hypothetical protein
LRTHSRCSSNASTSEIQPARAVGKVGSRDMTRSNRIEIGTILNLNAPSPRCL